MFDLLKKKISGFIGGFLKKEEEKTEVKPSVAQISEASAVKEETTKPIETEIEKLPTVEEEPVKKTEKPVERKEEKKPETKPEPKKQEKKTEVKSEPKKKEEIREIEQPKPKEEKKPEIKKEIATPIPQKAIEKPKHEAVLEIPKPVKEMPKEAPKHVPKEKPKEPLVQAPAQVPKQIPREIPKEPETKPKTLDSRLQDPVTDVTSSQVPSRTRDSGLETPKEKPKEPEKKHEVKIGIIGQIKSIFTGDVEITQQDVDPLLQALELDLLEADVGLDVAAEIKNELETGLANKKIRKSELNAFVRDVIRNTLVRIAKNEKAFDLIERIGQTEKPVKIMFIGPNGSGKTTTIAKVAKMLMDHGFKAVFGAADTFRAAAVEQIDIHGTRLGVKTVKRDYGSDPTAVAYDAMNYAKAHSIDVVLIDTAGRQDTNVNLINELKKMTRVIQPQLKIYIGESIAGTVIVDQVTKFNSEIGIDGIILTKLDCDPKGGTILSLSKITGIPIIYIGTGQGYENIEKFDAEKMVEQILS